jgi:hypothetical protein
MHRVVGKLISKATMIQKLLLFIFKIKSYVSNPNVVLTIFKIKTTSDPLYFGKYISLTIAPMMLKF